MNITLSQPAAEQLRARLAELGRLIRATMDAAREAVLAAARALRQLAAAARAARLTDRPAWATPYGPAPRPTRK